MKTAKINRIHPEGSTLTGARGRAFAIGDRVEDGAALTLATPDGSSGAVSISAPLALIITSKRLAPPVPIAIQPIAAEDTGPATPRTSADSP